MDTNTGRSLSAYINTNSTRFSSTVLDYARQSWVIIRDNKAGYTQTYVEPIVDVPDYLRRAARKTPRLDEEYQNLLLTWLALQAAENRGNPSEMVANTSNNCNN